MAAKASIAIPGEASEKRDAEIPTFREVSNALSLDTAIRSAVLTTFKAQGGDFNRWQRGDLRAMASAITKAEDGLELAANGRMTGTRLALRSVRRRLEVD